jgi:5'-nucleotidase (lipoprotein e(P4) family)
LLWFQSSAEAQALFYQAYQLARHRLDEELRQAHAAPPALVIDIDETILDNSPHQAKLIATSEVFPAYWDEWVNRAEALPLPGALGFLQFADSSGVAIFYLSNRDERMLEATMRNLVGHGFPQLSRDRFLLRSEESSKKGRRAQISGVAPRRNSCAPSSDGSSLFSLTPITAIGKMLPSGISVG